MARSTDSKLLDAADKIYIAFRWSTETLDYNYKAIEKITSMTKAKIFVFGQKSLSKSSIDIAQAAGPTAAINQFASRFKSKETLIINNKLSKIKNITFIDMMQLTCPGKTNCVVLTPQNKPIFFDPSHLTKEGAQHFGKTLIPLINESKENI